MAKDTDQDDDDKFEKMDEESLSFLEQVRKGKSRNFVLSMKGNKVRSMIVKKKPVKEKDRKAAKGEGYQPVYGVVTGKGAQINFMVARSDGFDEKAADRKTEKLKKFLSQQTGKVFKPTFELVDNPPPVPFDDEDLNDPLIAKFMKMEPVINKACDAHPDSTPLIQTTVNMIRGLLQDEETRQQAAPKIDEFVQYLKDLLAGNAAIPPAPPFPDSTAAPASPESSDSTPPPPPPPPPPTTDPAVLAGKLAELLKKLKPLMDQVINGAPDRKGELHATMAQIVGEIKAKQFDQAKQNVTDFATLLKSLASQQPAPSMSDSLDRSQEFAQRRNTLEPRLLEAQKADREKATKLGAVWDYADQQATAGNYANAFTALNKLETAIDGIVPQTANVTSDAPKSEDSQRQQLQKQMDALQARLLEAQKANPDAATKLGAAWGMATEKLQANDFASVVKILERLEPAIQNALESAPKTDTERFGIRDGIVAEQRDKLERYFRERVASAKVKSFQEVSKIEGAIADVPDEDPQELAQLIQASVSEMYDDATDELVNALSSGSASKVKDALKSWRGQVANDPLIQHMQTTGSAIGVSTNVLGDFDQLFVDVERQVDVQLAESA